jgi:MFS family permease
MNPNFRWLVIARFLFVMGTQVQAVLMGWQMYDMTHDPLQLGMIGLAEAGPALSLALISGWLVDQFNPLKFYRMTLALSFGSLWIASQADSPNGLYLAAFLTGIARSFTSPAANSIIPRIVNRDEIKKTSAFTTIAFKGGMVLGPGIAGLLLAIQGYVLPYRMAMVCLLVAFACVLMIDYSHPRVVKAKNPALLHELLVGVKYVFKHPLLLSVMSLDMFAVLFGGVMAMLPIYAAEILHMGPSGLGWLRASPAIGAIFMSVYLIRKPIGKNAGPALLWSVFGFGICVIVFGFSTSFWLSMAALALSGALDAVSMVVRSAVVQLASPENMRGRIASVNAIFIGSSNEIGQFESGVAAKLLGTVPSVIFGGTMTLVTVIAVFLGSKKLRKLDLDQL